MKENVLDEAELNQKEKSEEELNRILQELYNVKKRIDLLDLPNDYKPISISKYKSIKLTDKLKDSEGIYEEDVYGIEYENNQTELYALRDEELMLIATIDEKNQLILSDEEKEKYAGVTRAGELDKPTQIDEKDMEEQKEFEVSLEDRKDRANDSKEAQIANAIGVNSNNILMVVEIKDEATMSNVLNKNFETKNLYAVKLRQDSGGLGSNDWIIINQKSNGNFEQTMKQDPSDTMQDISQTVGLKRNNMQAPDLDPGDIDTVSRNGTRYTETNINGRRINDEYAILETQKDYKTTIHIAKENNGKAELLCEDEHSEHEEDKIEFPDRNVEIEKDKEAEEEDRTPGGDAYERRFEHRH